MLTETVNRPLVAQRRVQELVVLVLWVCISCFDASVLLAEDWRDYPGVGGCIGGPRCSSQPLELRLGRRVVERLRFYAVAEDRQDLAARVLVTLDGRSLDRELSVDARGRVFVLEGLGREADVLRFEVLGRQGVRIDSIEVLFADTSRRRQPATRSPRGSEADGIQRSNGSDGWSIYRNEQGCIGGELCQRDSLVLRLEDQRIEQLRFTAHDDIGDRYEGKLNVRLDDRILARRQDVGRQLGQHTLDVAGQRGDFLIFEAVTRDEVMIDTIEILYEDWRLRTSAPVRQERRPSTTQRRRDRYDGPGECLGGRLCSTQYRLELPLQGLTLEGVRFHAHADVGEAYDSRLRILLDREVLAEDLEVPRRGDFFQFETDAARSRFLVFEAIGRGEVVVEDIEVRYAGQAWTRHRADELTSQDP